MNVYWFLITLVFLWGYALAAKKLEKCLIQKRWSRQHLVAAWLLLFIGLGFVGLEIGLAYFDFDRQKILASMFIWFCAHGIFSVLVARIAVGLLKCIRQHMMATNSEAKASHLKVNTR